MGRIKRHSIIGRTFGLLTAIRRDQHNGSYQVYCECSCGGHTWAPANRLANGARTSCGCRGVTPRNCKRCGAEFVGKRPTAEYCSRECQLAHKANQTTAATMLSEKQLSQLDNAAECAGLSRSELVRNLLISSGVIDQ